MNPGDEYNLTMTCGHGEKRTMTKERLSMITDIKMYLASVKGIGDCTECRKQRAIELGWPSGSCLY